MTQARWWIGYLEKAIENIPGNSNLHKAYKESDNWARCAIAERKELLEIRGVEFDSDGGFPSLWEVERLGNKFTKHLKKAWLSYTVFWRRIYLKRALKTVKEIDHWIETHPVIKEEQNAQPVLEKDQAGVVPEEHRDDMVPSGSHDGKRE